MTNRIETLRWVGLMAVGVAAVPLMMSGCGKKEPPPPPRVDTFVPPPPPPAQADVVALLQEMDADSRVQFPEEVAPIDVDYARAIISFASSFAKGDEEALRGMLDVDGQKTLDALVETGAWYDETDAIEAVRVVYLTEPVEGAEGAFGGLEDLDGAIEDAMGDEFTPEALRDQTLEEIRNEGLTTADIFSRFSEQSTSGMGGDSPSFGKMSAEDRQMAEAMFGAEFIQQVDKVEADLAALETEFAQSNISAEELVQIMYDRGIFADMSEAFIAMMGGMGNAMSALFEGLGEAMGGLEGMENMEGFEGMGDIGSMFMMTSGGADLRLAIQKPGAAFALSFTAHKMGERYIFSPAPEDNIVMVRASDFTGKSAGIGSFGSGLGDLDFGDLFGNPDRTPSDGDSTQGGGGDSPTRPNVPTGPGPSSPGG